jgi:hypothetical protein
LTLNRELCEIVENDYKSARVYLRENLGLELGSLE